MTEEMQAAARSFHAKSKQNRSGSQSGLEEFELNDITESAPSPSLPQIRVDWELVMRVAKRVLKPLVLTLACGAALYLLHALFALLVETELWLLLRQNLRWQLLWPWRWLLLFLLPASLYPVVHASPAEMQQSIVATLDWLFRATAAVLTWHFALLLLFLNEPTPDSMLTVIFRALPSFCGPAYILLSARSAQITARQLTVALLVCISWSSIGAVLLQMQASNARLFLEVLSFVLDSVLCPIVVCIAFQHVIVESDRRSSRIAGSEEELLRRTDRVRALVYSLVPEHRVRLLNWQVPREWHATGFDVFHHVTIVQMDISGFTALSSELSAMELLDFVNSIFTSIDSAADCIGKVWKVETIGDCYKAVLGGPNPCDDPTYRGVMLAHTIIDIVTTLSETCDVALDVRVGVHVGSITAAMVGVELPRYMIYGPDVEITSQLESSADTGTVALSREAVAALARDLGEEWEHVVAKTVEEEDGSLVEVLQSVSEAETALRMEAGRAKLERLGVFMSALVNCNSFVREDVASVRGISRSPSTNLEDIQGEGSADSPTRPPSLSPSLPAPLSLPTLFRRAASTGNAHFSAGNGRFSPGNAHFSPGNAYFSPGNAHSSPKNVRSGPAPGLSPSPSSTLEEEVGDRKSVV